MTFIEKVRKIATGKTPEEAKQEYLARQEAQKEIRAASFQARKEQAVRFAVEREKIATDKRLQQLRTPPKPMSISYGSPFGQQPQSLQPRTKTRYVTIKSKPKIKRRIKRQVRQVRKVAAPQRFDVVGGGLGQRRNGGYSII
jgi:hypothetical protein